MHYPIPATCICNIKNSEVQKMKYLKSFLKALVKVVLIFAIIIGIIVVLMNKFFYKTKTPITSQEFYNMMISQDVSVVETSDDLG